MKNRFRLLWPLVLAGILLLAPRPAAAGERQPQIRLIDDQRDAALVHRLEAVRETLPAEFRKRNNFAWAVAKIDGLDQAEYFAHSGIQDFRSLSAEETNRIATISLRPDEEAAQFKVLCVNQGGKVDGPDCWYRSVDTEFKILEDIASRLPDPAVTGRLRLYTELYPCPSCRGVMQQFLARYTNVQMQVLYRRK